MKPEFRVFAFDDAPKSKESNTLVLGVFMRSNKSVGGFAKFHVTRDGFDSTEKLIKCVANSKFYKLVRVVFVNGISFAGFNMIDIQRFHEKTGIPIMTVIRKKPNMSKMKKAMQKLPGYNKRIRAIRTAGRVKKLEEKDIYYQAAGLNDEDAIDILKSSSFRSNIPEGLRMSHMILSALRFGESRGKP